MAPPSSGFFYFPIFVPTFHCENKKTKEYKYVRCYSGNKRLYN